MPKSWVVQPHSRQPTPLPQRPPLSLKRPHLYISRPTAPLTLGSLPPLPSQNGKRDASDAVRKVTPKLCVLQPYIWTEETAIQVVSTFGTYLGSIATRDLANRSTWLAVVATKLQRVPHNVAIVIGGLEHTVSIKPVKWSHGLLYTPTDLPQLPEKYSRPNRPHSTDDSSGDERGWADEEPVRRFLRKICGGRDLSTLPEPIRSLMAGMRPPNIHATTVGATGDQTATEIPLLTTKARQNDVRNETNYSPIAAEKYGATDGIANRKTGHNKDQMTTEREGAQTETQQILIGDQDKPQEGQKGGEQHQAGISLVINEPLHEWPQEKVPPHPFDTPTCPTFGDRIKTKRSKSRQEASDPRQVKVFSNRTAACRKRREPD